MKTVSEYFKMTLAFIWVMLLLFGCQPSSHDNDVSTRIKKAKSVLESQPEPDEVMPVFPNTVPVQVKPGDNPFRVETRKDRIKRFKCSQCHIGKKVHVTQADKIAHGEIKSIHGGKERPLACDTCHNKDDRDILVTEKGVKVDFDHSYQLCGHCHFREKADWAGGAHGKRVSFWTGERVVRNCTWCHNPHSPRLAKRWPKTYSLPLHE